MRDQRRQILEALAQRRQVDAQHRQSSRSSSRWRRARGGCIISASAEGRAVLTIALAIVFLFLVALDLLRDRPVDPRPVLTHPRALLLVPALGAAAGAWADDLALFFLSCAALGALAATVTERFRLTDRGIECRGALLEWRTLEALRLTPLFLELRTSRGQRLRLPRWMDGLGTLTRAAERSTLSGSWSGPGASSN